MDRTQGLGLPSVTEILGIYFDWDKIPKDRLLAAQDRGISAHDAIYAFLTDTFYPVKTIQPEAKGYYLSFLSWFEETVDKVIYAEKELICNCFGFQGHVDFVGILEYDNLLTVLDWKTPITEQRHTWRAQVCTYWHLVQVHGCLPKELPQVGRCGSIMLRPDGKPARMKEYTKYSARYFNYFVMALGAWKGLKGV